MRKLLISALLLCLAAPAWADGTINTLGAAATIAGTESIPVFQTANPAVKTTPNALDTYLSQTTKTLTNKTVNCANNTCTVRIGSDVTGLGTGAATALAINVGSAGAFLKNNGDALSGTYTGNPTFSGTAIVFSGAAAGTQATCVGLTSGGVLATSTGACGTGGGGGGTPVVFIGPQTAGSANTYTQAATTPTGFALTDGYIVRTRINATNTGASTLNVNSTGATAIQTNTLTGLQALAGGELAANLQYDFTYNGTCTCFVLMNASSGVVVAGTTQTVTTAQWTAFTVFDVSTSSQTLTLPLGSTLSPNGGIVIRTLGQTATLAPNASDKIHNGTTLGSAGTSLTIPAASTITVTTNAAAAPATIWAPLGGSTITVASGTSALGTGAISSAACATVVTTSAPSTATTDVVLASFNGDPTGVTGYVPLTDGMLTIISYPSSGNVNFKVCNNTAGSITPGAITLNWRVVR